MSYERSIKLAFDKLSGEIFDADEIFKESKIAFEVRRKFHNKEFDLTCLECEQGLNVSVSKYDRLHFKHQPKSLNCILKDGNLSPKDADIFYNILRAKESPRHFELKNKISEKLRKTLGVNLESLCTDNKFIIKGDDKRKPDVYCKYLDKELVFEIQLSNLSLSYILNRYNFYHNNGIYLIWILDNFNVSEGQSQMERDIKYLTESHNFFKLDEKSEEFMLLCEYKKCYIYNNQNVRFKWENKSVSLEKIKFNQDSYQIYYYNFEFEKQNSETELSIIKKKIENETTKRELQKEKEEVEIKIEEIISQIKSKRKNGFSNYSLIHEAINELNRIEIMRLNERLGLTSYKSSNLGKPFLNDLIYKGDDYHFITFFLDCPWIKFDINAIDNEGTTIIQEVLKSKLLFGDKLLQKIFNRNYELSQNDLEYLLSLELDETERTKLKFKLTTYNELKYEELTSESESIMNVLLSIESIKKETITGFRFPNWISFINNAIDNYKRYWEYIELTLKYYGLFEKLKEMDKKGSYQKKLDNFYSAFPQQDYSKDEIFKALYPEIFEY